jgi:hypothetical protein
VKLLDAALAVLAGADSIWSEPFVVAAPVGEPWIAV